MKFLTTTLAVSVLVIAGASGAMAESVNGGVKEYKERAMQSQSDATASSKVMFNEHNNEEGIEQYGAKKIDDMKRLSKVKPAAGGKTMHPKYNSDLFD